MRLARGKREQPTDKMEREVKIKRQLEFLEWRSVWFQVSPAAIPLFFFSFLY